MSRPSHTSAGDADLQALLEIERRLEARISEAQAEASRRIAAARATAQRTDDAWRSDLEAEAHNDEVRDLQLHAAELIQIAADAESCRDRFAGQSREVIERLARGVYNRVIEGG